MITYLRLFFLFTILIGCAPQNEDDSRSQIYITSAASLTDVMNEMKANFEAEHPNIEVVFQFGGSRKLAQQIIKGAPSDIFISANEREMDMLTEEGLIAEQSRFDFATNSLFVITKESKPSIQTLNDLKSDSFQYIAIGDPASAPVGMYTKEALVHTDLWEAMEEKFVFAKDVRQVLTYVESGNADAGIVYASDVAISNKVHEALEIDSSLHSMIIYPAALTASGEEKEEAQLFLEYLNTDEAAAILKNFKFQ
jgi:molybdate transport system substrate-binding protein